MIKIQYNTISEDELYRYLISVSGLFIPSLEKVVNIKSYANKIYNNALIIESWDDNVLVGIIACYANNNKTKEAYITCVCISKEYQGKGISKILFNHLYDILRLKQFLLVSLEVNKENTKALNLYQSQGFKFNLEKVHSYILSKRL